jgi:hypothetical protein
MRRAPVRPLRPPRWRAAGRASLRRVQVK